MERYDNVDDVIAFARDLPDFPHREEVIKCLETRNMNRYAQALTLLEESRGDVAPANHQQLLHLEERIKALSASDLVSE
jgi:hypothetical protein